jgi:hypothetical protein
LAVKAEAIFVVALALTAVVTISAQTEPKEASCEPTTIATTEETTEYITEPTETEVPTTEATESQKPYTEEELEMLALVIYQEAGGDACSDETRLMVGTVVMNRVADPRFPNTLYEVLTQKRQYGRLYWTGLVWAERASNPNEAHAVERAYKCAEKILSGYRSFDADVIWQAEFVQGTEIVAYQDGMYFCR